MKVYYDWLDKELDEDINEHLKPLRKDTPNWWQKLNVFYNGAKTFSEFVKTVDWEEFLYAGTMATVKVCPGFNQHFDNSLLMKFPCDILLETTEHGEWRYKLSKTNIEISGHAEDQAPELLKKNNFLVIKFQLKYIIKTDKKSQLSFMDPILYKDQPYRASPGAAYCNENAVQPNFICFFPKINQRYYFKFGEPMAVLQFSDKINSLEQKDLTKDIKRLKGGNKSFFLYSKK